jgi:hypothetical protein
MQHTHNLRLQHKKRAAFFLAGAAVGCTPILLTPKLHADPVLSNYGTAADLSHQTNPAISSSCFGETLKGSSS